MPASLSILVASAMLLVLGCAASGAESYGGGGNAGGGVGATATTTATLSSGGDATGGFGGASGGTSSSGGSTTGVPLCDDAGECGNTGRGCVACAINDACAEVYDACFSSDDCKTYGSCVSMCVDDEACAAGCEQQTPDGKAPYDAFFLCVICGECKTSCGPLEACPAQ